MRFRGRKAGGVAGALVGAAVLALVSVVPAGAAVRAASEPVGPVATTGSDTSQPTGSPGSTVAPGTTVAPTGPHGPDTTSAPSGEQDGSTTTSSSTSSTSVAETTTLPPVDESVYSGSYAGVPAPLIPSIEDDPLFHAARMVDADLLAVSEAKATHLHKIAATRKVAARAAATRTESERVAAIDDTAVAQLAKTRSILRAAALHAYAGYGTAGADASGVDGSGSIVPSRTYVRVTIADASRHVDDASKARDRTRSDAAAAARTDDAAQTALRAARTEERDAKQAVADAEKKLKDDRDALRLQIASMPDMAPGMFDRLPDSAELPEGAIGVESPVGTIVVPATADPRTAVALEFIVAQIGKPYIWGGTGPTGYDCSGLMLRGFQAAGVTSMPRVSQAQQPWATPVPLEELQPGDLVFFGNPAYHVGIYIGGGLMINAPYTGARVRVDKVWSSVSGYGRARW